MEITYNDILKNMKNTFYEECGERVDELSDLGARFRTLAGELFSIYCFGEHIMKQAFVQTASGEYLDYHAELRGLSRKQESKAVGRLLFRLSEPLSVDTEINAGTICAHRDKPYIQYVTDRTAVIPAGETEIRVSASAVSCGDEYNASLDEITVMVNPPIGVTSVTNPVLFLGGYDGEGDEKLRRRIMSSCKCPVSGITSELIERAAMELDDVHDCKAVNTGNRWNIYIRNPMGGANAIIAENIAERLAISDFVSKTVRVLSANTVNLNLTVEVKVSDDCEEKIRDMIYDYVDSLRIGEALNLTRLMCSVLSIDGVDYCKIRNEGIDYGDVVASESNSYFLIESLEINYV